MAAPPLVEEDLEAPDSTNPFLAANPRSRKRRIHERTRWSSRQKSTAIISDLPRLSPIPRRRHCRTSPLPVLEKEGDAAPKEPDEPSIDQLGPSSSQADQTFGINLEKGGIKCNVCDKVFKTRPSFNAHRINKHNIVVRVRSYDLIRRRCSFRLK